MSFVDTGVAAARGAVYGQGPEHTDPINRRVYDLLMQGHSWMGTQTLYALAGSGLSDGEIGSLAERMRQLTVQGVRSNALNPMLHTARRTIMRDQTGLNSAAQYTSAATSGSDASQQALNQKARQVGLIARQAQNPDDGFKHFFDDPVLQKHPSAGLALKRYLSGVLGPVPVAESDSQHIQKQLQLQGFGRDLPATGVWSQGWQGAQNQWKNHIFESQLSGDKPGSVSFGHAMNALQALTPTSAWNALIGYAKAIPDAGRQIVGDLAGGVSGTAYMLTQAPRVPFFSEQSKGEAEHFGRASADVVNALGGDTTAKKETSAIQNNPGLRALEDVSNIWVASSALGAAGRFGQAAGLEAAASSDASVGAALTKEAAFNGPGTIAKSLSSQIGGNPAFARAALGGVLGAGGTAVAGGTPKEIALGGALGAGVGGLSNTNAFQNIPILGRTGPFIDALADGNGFYYKMRQLVHAPYSWVSTPGGDITPIKGAVGSALRLGDTGFQSSLLEGAKIRGLAQAQDWVGGDQSTNFSKSVEQTHTLDAVNDAIGKRLGFTVLGQHIAPSVDDLMFTFGGQGAHALGQAPSEVIQQHTNAISQAMTNALGDPGWAASIVHATGNNLHTLIKEAGGQENFNQFWGWKIAEHAVSFEAERRLAQVQHAFQEPELGPLASTSRLEQLRGFEHEVWNDPAQLAKAITDLRAQAGNEEFTARLKRDIAYGSMEVRGTHADAKALVEAQKLVRQRILPHVGDTFESATPYAPQVRLGAPEPEAAASATEQVPGQMALQGTSKEVRATPLPALRKTVGRLERGLKDIEGEMNDAAKAAEGTTPEARGARIKLRSLNQEYEDTFNAWSDASNQLASGTEAATPAKIRWSEYANKPTGTHPAPVETPALVGAPEGQMQLGLTKPVTQPVMTGVSSEKGALGIARSDYFTQRQANLKINEFQRRFDALGPVAPIEDVNRLDSDMAHYLEREFAVHSPDMPQHGQDLIDTMHQHAAQLAGDVFIHPDAPQELHDAVAALGEKGYKLVTGTDIGHAIHDSAPVDAMEGPLTWQRRIAEHAAINPTTVPDANISTHRFVDMASEVQKEVRKGKIALPPFADPVTVLAYLRKEGILEESPGGVLNAIKEGAQTIGTRRLAKDMDIPIEDARSLMETPMQLRDTARKKVVDALSGPTSGRRWAENNEGSIAEFNRNNPDAYMQGFNAAEKAGDPLRGFEHPPMSREHAQRFYAAVVKGSATPPAYLMGASRMEDLFRASMGFAGKALPGDWSWALANLPNALIQVRNNLRFDLSPAFGFRRIVKTNAKLAAEGIDPVLNPAKAMRQAGTFDEDLATLERVRPSYKNQLEMADSADRYAQSQDLFGLYNPAMHEARAAGMWARQGLSDNEIDQKLIRTFEYGTGGVKGRSALERTTNFVFFPFSFEKTLYRNLGAYILDKPAQRLVMTRALAAYDEFNKAHQDDNNPLATAFWTKHAPVLQEAERLNAFAHGISLGEPGGINRPLLNMFLPQSWTPNANTQNTLARFIPAITDGQRVMNELVDQGAILKHAGQNLVTAGKQELGVGQDASYMDGGKWNAPGPEKSTLAQNADLEAGFVMLDKWMADNKDLLDHNRHTTDQSNKYRFPMAREWGRLAGEPITPDAIREIVQAKHPGFKAEKAVQIATQRSQDWKNFVLDSKGEKFASGQSKAALFDQFSRSAEELGRAMDTPGVRQSFLVERTANLRQAALQMAEEDAGFYDQYQKNFAKFLGPLESAH